MTDHYINMSQSQIEEFLQVQRFAIVGTNRVNGPPQLTPMWYLYENGRVYFSMGVNSVKYKNLRRDPRISICVVGDCPDARAVMFKGTVDLFQEGSAEWVDEIMWRLVRRYHDNDDQARAYRDSPDDPEESTLAVVTAEKIIAQDYN